MRRGTRIAMQECPRDWITDSSEKWKKTIVNMVGKKL